MTVYNPQMPAIIASSIDHHRRNVCQIIKKADNPAMHMYYEGQRVAYEYTHRLVTDAFRLNDEQARGKDE